jgi:hypothetical protein
VTPTALTLRLLRRRGYLADVCEGWLPIPGKSIRRDLFGAFDVVGLHLDVPGVTAVQITTLPNLPARVAKLRGLASVRRWLACGNQVELHGWSKRGRRWRVKRVMLRAADLAPIVVEAPPRRLPVRYRQLDLFGGLEGVT